MARRVRRRGVVVGVSDDGSPAAIPAKSTEAGPRPRRHGGQSRLAATRGPRDTAITYPPRRFQLGVPEIDREFRQVVLEWSLSFMKGPDLTDWLRNLKQPTQGTVDEKLQRIREHTTYPTMTPAVFRDEFLAELRESGAEELKALCDDLQLDNTGTKAKLFRRCFRALGYREKWLSPVDAGATPTLASVLQFVEWYPILVRSDYEKDHYNEFEDEMSEVFGDGNVHDQHAVALGVSLKIDFHIGDPMGPGVGVEFKLPASTSDIQKALGQISLYAKVYGPSLIVVILPQMMRDDRQVLLLVAQVREAGLTPVVKST